MPSSLRAFRAPFSVSLRAGTPIASGQVMDVWFLGHVENVSFLQAD